MKSGEKVYYDLEEQPKTTFSGKDIVITTNTLEVTYPLTQVLRYTYDNAVTGIESTSDGVHISRKGDVVTFQNLSFSTTVQLFTIDGMLLETYDVEKKNSASISLKPYPTGIYILKVGGVSFKMIKR